MRPSTSDLLVLHGLRLKGFVAAAPLVDALGLPLIEVERLLDLAQQDGFARFRAGSRSGWSLTDEGRKENERLLAVELDDAGLRGEVTAAYQRFLALNPTLLAVCTRWQITDLDRRTLNDHTDPRYDAAVLAELGDIHDGVLPICAVLGEMLDRYRSYGPRLSAALDRLRNGQIDWLTKPTIDSYHTVWFELHEDLLVTLGLERAAEHT